jgi:DNA-binding MarR family transcriptional regulator
MKQLDEVSIDRRRLICGDLLIDVVPLVMAFVRACSAQIKPADLTVAQFRALAFIGRHSGMSMSSLAEFLGLTLSCVSKHVDTMVQLGYVHHEVCADDRRRASLHLSEKGQKTMALAREDMSRRLAAQLADLGPEATDTVTVALQDLQQVFALIPSATT